MSEDLLRDGFQRSVEYLRLSVTDRCSLRCDYCMPAGMKFTPNCDMLKFSDFLFLVDIFASLGIRKVRVTGGEPLIRRGILRFLRQLKEIPGIERTVITTNGLKLYKMAPHLKSAGVAGLNVSLDSLDREKYKKITGADQISKVISGIDSAIEAGFGPVKVNVVAMKGVNDDEFLKFAELTRDKNIQVRFIEFMPATPSLWSNERFIAVPEIKAHVEKLGPLVSADKEKWGGPAEIYKLEGAVGQIGFISAVSRHFCESCNRLRLTSTGQLMTCLFGKGDLDLRKMINGGANKKTIKQAIRETVFDKNGVRVLPTAAGPGEEKRSMSCVGG
ncbi:Cyclic pyranopterin phosphate synthase (MoaA) [hydrothermal vent metagenome]|uniref:Cyclic pyranopterin phosphate synthase (MoaA) n=1 Tax=hydrothermal vent metagenome TaxID=652676 RepID=A0A3B1BS53_9ZZZZ